MRKNIIFVLSIIVLFLLSCKSSKSSSPVSSIVEVPNEVYITSNGYPQDLNSARSKIIGKWMYANNQFFEFKADKTWEYYISYDGGTTKLVYYNGYYEVYENVAKTGFYYLALSYNQIGISNLNELYGDPTPHLYNYDPYGIADVPKKRYQIVELYVDDNVFGMNIYRNTSDKYDLLSGWVHANFDFFNNYWTYSTILLSTTQTYFENTMLAEINSDKSFVQTCYTEVSGDYVNNCTTDPNKSKLNSILTTYVSGYGEDEPPSTITSSVYNEYLSSIDSSFVNNCYYLYSGLYVLKSNLSESDNSRLERIMLGKHWDGVFWVNLTNNYAYKVNREGTLIFRNDGNVEYTQVSPYFTQSTLPSALVSPVLNVLPATLPPTLDIQTVNGTYSIVTETLTNSNGDNLGKRVYLSWVSASPIMGTLRFEILIVKDKNILITFPFYRQ
ncbi:MAG TPA: hypothetical protein PKW55_05045 [Spirochaetota bacterium]|nr:hypothetical protein [Spirochaetota bacterium]HOM37682.1 hypothetical protein [Spirochaetota bacterium]HPQ49640.1 hypothetical protein [Spirochaetota bacterium]